MFKDNPVHRRFEQEAEIISERVMDRAGNSRFFFPGKKAIIQPKCACEKPEDRVRPATGNVPHIQRQAATGEEEDQTGEVLTGGLGTVASEAMEHEPFYNFLEANIFNYLKNTFWEDRSDAEKALIVGHSLLTLAPIGSVFTTARGRETFSGVDIGSAFSWIPYNPIGGFSYYLPDALHPTTRFHLELQADDYLSILHESNDRIPEMALSLALQGEQRASGGFGLTGGSLELSIGGGIVDLKGFVNQPISPYPILLPGRDPGDSPTWLMRSLPGIPEESWPRGTGFFFP